MTRDKKVEALIEDWINSIVGFGGAGTLRSLLELGHKGYNNMTDEEVDKDYADAFGEDAG